MADQSEVTTCSPNQARMPGRSWLSPAVLSPGPNSKAPELKCSIKVEPSKHSRTLCSKFSASKHLRIQAAVTVPHGNFQFACLALKTTVTLAVKGLIYPALGNLAGGHVVNRDIY